MEKLPIRLARQRIKLVLNGPPLIQEMAHIMHQIPVASLWLPKEMSCETFICFCYEEF